jgi:predicted nuclease with TOPRIM domain
MEADSESENSNPLNEIERQLINDLQEQWKDPATKGDLRNHAVRMDSRFGKIDVRFDKMDARFDKMDARFDKMDARLDKIDGRFDVLENKIDSRFTKQDSDLKEYVNKMGWKFAGLTISTTLMSMIGILSVFAAWIK